MIFRLPVLIFAILFLIIPHLKGQNSTAEEIYNERLYYLGKIWGYTKYFHPEVAACRVAWDETLLKTIPLIKDAANNSEFNQLLVEMLESIGTVPTASSSPISIDHKDAYNLNLTWFNDEKLNAELRSKLEHLRDNFRPRAHCKLKPAFSSGNIVFEEDNYLSKASNLFPDETVRALAVFRYWNIINYFFPYKYQLDQDWDTTLKQFIPIVIGAKSEEAYHLGFREMTTYINDSHAFFGSPFFSNWIGSFRAPFFIKYIENQTVITKVHPSVADKLMIGDIITAIDEMPIDFARERLRIYNEGSNEPTIQRNINGDLTRGQLGKFEVTVKNELGERTVELERKTFTAYQSLFNNNGVAFETILGTGGCEVGYIDMDLLTVEAVPAMFEQFKNLPAIIVDVRNYPQGTLWEMVNYLYPDPVNFAAITHPDTHYPGVFTFRQHSIGQGGTAYAGRLIILFDEDTQSQAEFTIMGLEKHPNAIKIGSQTAGADGNVSKIELPGVITTYFTGLGIFYPDGRETQRIGIVPDIELRPTIKGIREGRDELLDFALACNLTSGNPLIITNTDEVDVFPNPVANQLNIKSEVSNYTVEVRDVLGRFVEAYKIGANNFDYSLNMSALNNGVYLLAFINKDGVFATKKIVKL